MASETVSKKRVNGMIQITVIAMDVLHDTQKPPQTVRIRPQAYNRDLLQLLSRELNFTFDTKVECGKITDGEVVMMTLATSTSYNSYYYDGGKSIYEWVSGGDTIYIAINIMENKASKNVDAFKHKLHKIATNITIHHNTINVNIDNIMYNEKMNVDTSMKVITLKSQICQSYGIPLNEVIIRKGYHGQALRDNHSTLKDYNIHRSKIIHIERGKINENEYILQIFVQNEIKQRVLLQGWIHENINEYITQIIPDSVSDIIFEYYYIQKGDDPLIYIDDISFNKDWPMTKIKDIISKKCIGKVPKTKRMRIREFVNNRLTRLYYDDNTLGENCRSIHDYKQICVQRKWRKNEAEITKKHILLNCVRWYPSMTPCSLGPMIEFLFSKKMKIKSELKDELSEITGIDRENLEYTMIHGYQLKEYAKKERVRFWKRMYNMTNGSSTLVSTPWMCKQGDIILYVDKREF